MLFRRGALLRVYWGAGRTRIYELRLVREIHAASADVKTYSESLKAAFPDRQLASVVGFLRQASLRRASLNRADRLGPPEQEFCS